MRRSSETARPARVANKILSLLLPAGVLVASLAAAEVSTQSLRSTKTKKSQCTGENVTIALEGTLTVERQVTDGVVHYTVTSQLSGSATGQGNALAFAGEETAELDDPAPEKELVMLNHLRAIGPAGAGAVVGFDTERIRLDQNGRATKVTSDFEFTCD